MSAPSVPCKRATRGTARATLLRCRVPAPSAWYRVAHRVISDLTKQGLTRNSFVLRKTGTPSARLLEHEGVTSLRHREINGGGLTRIEFEGALEYLKECYLYLKGEHSEDFDRERHDQQIRADFETFRNFLQSSLVHWNES